MNCKSSFSSRRGARLSDVSRFARRAFSGPLLFLVLWLGCLAPLEAALPVVSNVRAAQRPGTKLVDIHYDLADADGNAVTVYLYVSADSGANWNVPAYTFTGAYGPGMLPGANKLVIWNAGEDWDGQFSSRCRVRVMAFDLAPDSPVLIPAGAFQMGDTFGEGDAGERPVHTVSVSAFYIDSTEVTETLRHLVHGWAIQNGYSFDNAGAAKGADHPAHSMNWYDVAKWCNARSEMEGRTPVYYTSSDQNTVYRSGRVDQQNSFVKWTANGYRLPTEAEWEKAARGGLAGKRFPWGNTVTHYQANYSSSASYGYDTSQTRGYHPDYATSSQPYTSPVGTFAPNDYGLYDMAGNLWEWCWDWYDNNWYSNAAATAADTRGPGSGTYRVLRGGSWYYSANILRCADRNYTVAPVSASGNIGFRCVRGL